MTTPFPYRREAAIDLWGDAGDYVHAAYTRLRGLYFPTLPESMPIVIGLTAFGRCIGMTRHKWTSATARISIAPGIFAKGERAVDDLLVHEMAHVRIGRSSNPRSSHHTDEWYAIVNELSPAVLGYDVQVSRGADRKSVRVPDPSGRHKTTVRKVRVHEETQHRDVAGWPQSFRPDGYDFGAPISLPTY